MDYFETLARWYELSVALKHMQAEEKALREGLFQGTFPHPTEGVNQITLPDGRILKGTFKLSRKLDADRLNELADKGEITENVADSLVRWKAELAVKPYRELTEDVRAIVDTALEIKPGLPSLELVEAAVTVPSPE